MGDRAQIYGMNNSLGSRVNHTVLLLLCFFLTLKAGAGGCTIAAMNGTDAVQPTPIRERLRDINTKAYYLLVALSFIYSRTSATLALKWALTLTGIVAVLPVQDWITSRRTLEGIRIGKVACLVLALVFALIWVWSEAPSVLPHLPRR